MTRCIHDRRTDTIGMADCALGQWGGSPALSICQRHCKHRDRITGAGDLLARATKAVGIQPCGGCHQRQAALNSIMPISSEAPNA